MRHLRTRNKNAGHKSGTRVARVLVVVLGAAGLAGLGAVAGVIGAYYYVSPSLPQAETIRDIPLQIPLRIFSRDGYLISEIGQHRRVLVTYDEVPPHVIEAFIAAEDRRFFEHPGIDYRGVLRAFFQLLTTGDVESGGSTLTQQLARSYFLNLDQTADRKFREAALAVQIENEFSKEQIMELFLNKMFFGQRAYGVSAAAQVFFDKELEDLSIAEAATLAGVLPAPSRYNPVRSIDNATLRRDYVLGRMHALGFIGDDEYREALDTPMVSRLHGAAVQLHADYVAEMVRREMLDRYGEASYTDGYQVVTTLDSRLQNAATWALKNGLLEFTRRRGYRGPVARTEVDDLLLATPYEEWPDDLRDTLEQYSPGGLSVALVVRVNDDDSADVVAGGGARLTVPWSGIRWAKPFVDRETTGPAPESASDVLAPGDIVHIMPTAGGSWALAAVPEAQAAIVSMDPGDGAITSLAGGFDFATSKFNRVTQAYRQPGSSFKPFIYSAALAAGNTPATVVDDSPVVIRSSELEADWRPINYTGRFYGPTRLREALTRSMNLVTVRLLLYETGIGRAIAHLSKFGFSDAALPRNGSLALGGGNASPLDMVQAYSVLANGGYAVKPYVIDSIFGPDGEALYRANPAVVCRECEAEAERRYGEPEAEPLSLEEIAEDALAYRPDAATAPELFAGVNKAAHVVSEQNVFLIQDMMRDVIMRGTGQRAKVLGRTDLSGKTGTSNDRRDAWFGGFNADLAAIVWVGYDDDQGLGPGEEGGRTALPIWVDFARSAFAGVPNHRMPMPAGIVSRKINRETGCPADASDPNATFEYFIADNLPECENIEHLPDVFNDPMRFDQSLPGEQDPAPGESGDEEPEEEPETLF
ncbi:MAG TPA: PBP1A family penicillin-binding protein [Woeseiaceae bacterium]|nr:PBP1A family penicillin-binding protein [Woeseiaceae bacterium]